MITIMGLGFVGLTTGLGFAKKGFKTYAFDLNPNRVNRLRKFKVPFFEPHLEDVLKETYDETFFLNVDFNTAITNSEAIFICVGTPAREDGSADLTFLFQAINQIMSVNASNYQVIITKSTVPPSTVSEKVIPFVKEKLYLHPQRKIGFASNPEFLREGFCWEDFIKPDRIVVGIEDESAKEVLEKIYRPFEAPVHFVSFNTAEYIKYLSNTLLSTLISFSNEMSMIANQIGDINISGAFQILHEDKRWHGSPAGMSKYVYPGCGYGGYCLPKDTSALVESSKDNGFVPALLSANVETNTRIKAFIADRIEKSIDKSDTIGILGLSFKPDSDDVRDTPSYEIIRQLIYKGFDNIYAYDPIANEEFEKSYPELKVRYCQSLDEIINNTNNMVILTAWQEFITNKEKINSKRVFDFRYIY